MANPNDINSIGTALPISKEETTVCTHGRSGAGLYASRNARNINNPTLSVSPNTDALGPSDAKPAPISHTLWSE